MQQFLIYLLVLWRANIIYNNSSRKGPCITLRQQYITPSRCINLISGLREYVPQVKPVSLIGTAAARAIKNGRVSITLLPRQFSDRNYDDVTQPTVASMHWLSRMAPQHPRKPSTMTTEPMAMTMKAVTFRLLTMDSFVTTSAKLFSSTLAQIPMASNEQPTSWTNTHVYTRKYRYKMTDQSPRDVKASPVNFTVRTLFHPVSCTVGVDNKQYHTQVIAVSRTIAVCQAPARIDLFHTLCQSITNRQRKFGPLVMQSFS